MIVSRVSPFSGTLNRMELPITVEQYNEWLNGVPVQDAFPHLNADDREFILTGILPNEWDEMFPSEESREYVTDEYSGEYDDEVGPRDGLD